MKQQTYVLTAFPIPSVLSHPSQAALIKNASITVELTCSQMGRNNLLKIRRLVMPELLRQFGHLCKIGGCRYGEPRLKSAMKSEAPSTSLQ